MLIPQAYAQTAAAPGTDAMLLSWLPILAVIVIFYLIVMRPQQKRMKEHEHMVQNLQRGDTVLTTAGFHAEIAKIIDDHTMEVLLGEGVKVTMSRHAVSSVLKAKPRKADKPKK